MWDRVVLAWAIRCPYKQQRIYIIISNKFFDLLILDFKIESLQIIYEILECT